MLRTKTRYIPWPRLVVVFLFLVGSYVLPASAASQWATLSQCRLRNNVSNDGDSFHVVHEDKEYIFRLYFVDTPETDASLPERVADQAKYFGISTANAVKVGKDASKFTSKTLRSPFTVITRWQDAKGRSKLPRYYAFVVVDGKDLAEMLVEQGMARVYGVRANRPGGPLSRTMQARLLRMEKTAKAKGLGAWALVPSDGRYQQARTPNTNITPAPPSVPKTNVVPSTSSTNIEQTYRISSTGKRHNSKCRYFNSPNNSPCGPEDGSPCKICGG